MCRPAVQRPETDSSDVLSEALRRASRFCTNLDGRVRVIDGQLGRHGAIAIVYRGVLHREGKETMVAVKTFRSTPPNDMNALARVLRVVHLKSKLHHENIVPMLGICTGFGATISIVLRWMEMGDAHTYVQQVENDPRPLLMDIASGLHYLHTHELGPICHGNLRGSNVLISDDRRALLAGFSLSTLTESSFSSDISVAGGSLEFMAPELFDIGDPSTAGDVWAFGMTVLELFTRLLPFHDCRSMALIMARLLRGKLPHRPAEASTCSRMTDAWWDLCTLCWQQDPASRPATSEILQKIKDIIVRNTHSQ
ncbi:hypothetical protein ID866_9157 [Astraeus odoratus]|nr:hypothetical protein ID866_9157 [Astraeus odoratus]